MTANYKKPPTELENLSRVEIRHDEKMPCADGNMMEKTAGADIVHDSHEHARCEEAVDNRNSNGRRELPVWLL